ncbi:glycerate kinase [Synoicihabitans lomoniglobus]|uniref:Glycerate kinase n=1 Tax=Synoicihabitans lomoniglobus TaxID=2909285 RepID=A0AAE9ZW99_9BACT|nr:glycerate kinase [Opitutaceae bacterium LMO-M01]WED65307.1 glycerate kinase [Opitutaceae bacterium LMO-M01]
MRVLVAFDKFKDALTAPDACAIAGHAIARQRPTWSVDACPLADGGEGFASILTAAVDGEWREIEVLGPRGAPTQAGYGLVDPTRLPAAARARLALGPATRLAVIEMAAASGLQSLTAAERDPWHTDTRGTGQLICDALAAGADAVLLGVGGSATHDVGLGALTALGWRAERADGSDIERICPAGWSELTKLIPGTAPLPAIRIACDVSNPLLGERGAAAVFGPQKGLRAEDLARLESETARIAQLVGQAVGQPDLESTPGAGAAGGIAYGFLTAANARLVPGFDLVEEWLDIAAKLDQADLVITGEGRFDDSSLEGKGPGALALRAVEQHKPVWIFAGAVSLEQAPTGCELTAITPPGTTLPEALATAGAHLDRTLSERLSLRE